MFLLRRPLRKEAQVFNLHHRHDLVDYNDLLANDGINVKIISQKEFSIRGMPPMGEDDPGVGDALYVFVTYELLNHVYQPPSISIRPEEFRPKKEKPSVPKKNPFFIKPGALTPEEEAIARQQITERGCVIEAEASDVTECWKEIEPGDKTPKVVTLDLNRAAQKKAEQKAEKKSDKGPKKPTKPRKPKG